MQNFLFLGYQLIVFWFVEAPKGLIDYFLSFNSAMLKFFSLQILLRTFFKPWKNEYREGLVGFSILMGIVIKSMIIFFDLLLFLIVFILEIVLIFLFICWPIATIAILFIWKYFIYVFTNIRLTLSYLQTTCLPADTYYFCSDYECGNCI